MKETLKYKGNKIPIHCKSVLLGPARKPFSPFFSNFVISAVNEPHLHLVLVSEAHSFISYLNDLLSAAMLPFLLIKHKWGNWVRCCLTAREGTLQKPSWKERQTLVKTGSLNQQSHPESEEKINISRLLSYSTVAINFSINYLCVHAFSLLQLRELTPQPTLTLKKDGASVKKIKSDTKTVNCDWQRCVKICVSRWAVKTSVHGGMSHCKGNREEMKKSQ